MKRIMVMTTRGLPAAKTGVRNWWWPVTAHKPEVYK
jgi:hypothetical protein